MLPEKNDLIPFIKDRKEAAKKFNVTEKTIINWMKKYNLYKPRENFGCNKLNFKKASEIRLLYKQGESIKSLSLKYKVTFATISRVINNLIYVEKTNKDTATINVVYNFKKINDGEIDSSKVGIDPDDIK